MDNTSPTKGQIGQIVALLVAEKVTFDEAKEFILAHRDNPSAKKREKKQLQSEEVKLPERDQDALDQERAWYFDRFFPRRGTRIVQALWPFYDYDRALELRSEMHDLHPQVWEAFGSQDIVVKRVALEDWESPCLSIEHARSMCGICRESSYSDDFQRLEGAIGDQLHTQIDRMVERIPNMNCWHHVGSSLREFLALRCYVFMQDVVDQKAARFCDRMSGLWTGGNPPYGFDVDDKLFVLIKHYRG